MLDLAVLRDGGRFDVRAEAPTRLALVHRGFRSVSVRRGISRQRFAAHFPPLGLLNLAHSLRVDAARGAVRLPEMVLFDEETYAGERELFEAVSAWLAVAPRRILAASTYTSTIDRLEAFLAEFDPREVLTMVGGAHASLAPDIGPAHLVVRGEGGAAIRHVLNAFITPAFGSGADAAGLCFRLDGREVLNTPAFDRSIEILPPPAFAYDLLAPPSQRTPLYATNFTRMLGRRPQIYICTQSCRARCTFCSTYMIHGKPVARPVAFIREDLTHLVRDLGHDSIEFHDDDLMQHPELDALLDVLGELGVPWFCYSRVDLVTPALGRRLYAAGCRRVFVGVESMNQTNLDYYNKEATVADNQRAIEALAAAGVGAVAGFIIGAPNDTVASILEELDRFLELPLFAINCSILSPDPGTVEFLRARKRGGDFAERFGGRDGKRLRVVPDAARYGIQSPMGLPSVCERVTKSDLNQLVTIVDVAFYFRERIWNLLTEGRMPGQVELIRDYYIYLMQTLDAMKVEDAHPRIRERVLKLRNIVEGVEWYERTSRTLPVSA